MIRLSIKISVLFIYCSSLHAQNDSLLKQKNTFSYSKYTVFAFYDAIRFTGIGAKYRPLYSFSIDVKAGVIYANGLALKLADKFYHLTNGYFYNKGEGIILSPKWHFGPKKDFYLGLYLAIYNYGYTNKVLSSQESITYIPSNAGYTGVNTNIINRGSNSISSYAFGQTIGFSRTYNHLNFEFFLAAGVEKANSKVSISQSQMPYSIQPSPPVSNTYSDNIIVFNALAGIKIGLGFKQQHLIAFKYYTTLLKNSIQEADNIVKEKKPSVSLSEETIDGYYTYRHQQFESLKESYKNNMQDPTSMLRQVELAGKKIKKYIADNF